MKVVVGDETGLLKVVNLNENNTASFGTQNRDFAVKGLDWRTSNEFLSVRENGIVELWKMEDQDVSVSAESQSLVKNPSSVQCIKNGEKQSFLCYNSDGDVSVENFLSKNVTSPSIFNVSGPVSTCATSGDGLSSIFGGRENDIHMYDMSTFQETWKAKNVPHDKLNLRVPIWITALSFLNSSDDSTPSNKIVSGTGYKHVRVYDVKTSRQPVISIDIGDDFRVTAVCPSGDGHSVYVGDTSGGLYMWDLRTQRRVYTLKGSTGSIRSLQMNSNGNQVASVGLDRYLRIYNTKNNRLLSSTYLKNRLNCCLINDESLASEKRSSSDDEDDDVKPIRSLNKVVNDRDEDLLEEYADSDDDSEEDQDEDEDEKDDSNSSDEDEEGSEDEESEEEKEEVKEQISDKKRTLPQDSHGSKKSTRKQ